MLPLFFGSAERRLFGVYEPAQRRAKVARAVLLCNSWGAEYVNAHHALRVLAQRLCAAGFDTLRFDYFGEGDSGGETTDADLDGWKQDIATAIGELKAMSSAPRVVVLGLRLGASLAAEVAPALAGDIDRLILWDPIVNGENYLAELEPAAVQHRMGDRFFAPVQGHETSAEIRGRVVSSAFVEGLRAIDLCSGQATAPSTLTIFSQPPPANCTRLQATQIVTVETVLPWQDIEIESGILPIQAYEQIQEWLR
ncbi:serine aminopeptidase domain-containing protein [Bradyrhizobium sp. STM 3557]|uniref:serine aminopeptidase domain-containing protein n=1 Tax=Bradyrhizobium sp. STM 3557 TaxID=578920 RepID=UPI00388E8B92